MIINLVKAAHIYKMDYYSCVMHILQTAKELFWNKVIEISPVDTLHLETDQINKWVHLHLVMLL